MRHFAAVFCLLFLSGLSTAHAQFQPATPPPDVLNFNSSMDEGIPDRIDDIVLPRIQFIFDELIDPRRESIRNFITSENVDDPRLEEAVRGIIRSHLIALQQTEIAIQYLKANRDNILDGKDSLFTSVYGAVGEKQTFAVLSPSPLGGLASLDGTLGTDLTLTFDDQQGGGGDGGEVTKEAANVASQVRPGDFLFLEDPDALNAMVGVTVSGSITGTIVRALQVNGNTPEAAANSGGGGQNNMEQEIILDPNFNTAEAAGNTMSNFDDTRVFKVIRFEERATTTRYEQVLATFEALRASLSGLDPNLPNSNGLSTSLRSPISYNRGFTDINTIWAPGIAEFEPLNDTVADFMTANNFGGFVSTRGADRLVRERGFSNSNSFQNVGRNEDVGLANHGSRTSFPLLWTEDNELPREEASPATDFFGATSQTGVNSVNARNLAFPGQTDEDRAFFRDQQTLFGEPDNVFTQHLGRAFFEETQNHPGLFLDNSINSKDRNSGEFDTGTSETTATAFRRWEMIMKSFAEYSSDFSITNLSGVENNAAVGVSELFGGFAPGDLSSKDAGNYPRFARLLGGSSVGGVDFSRIEPFGKRGKAGFNPVVSPF